LAKQSLGEVMIFQLAHHVENFLHTHKKPVPTSLYQQMIDRQTTIQKEKKLAADYVETKEVRQILI